MKPMCSALLILAAAGLAGAPAFAADVGASASAKVGVNAGDSKNGSLDNKDADFVKKAAMTGLTEVELSKSAQSKATDPAVRDFAKRMVTDHSQANDKLKIIAAKKGIALPTALDRDHQEDVDDFKDKTGKDFDEAYMDKMASDHHETIELFQEEAKDGKDQELRDFATKTLPTLQQHGDMAKDLEKKTDKS